MVYWTINSGSKSMKHILKQMFEVPLVLEQVETALVEEKFRNENSLGLVLKEVKESSVVINLKPFKVDFFKGTNEIRTS